MGELSPGDAGRCQGGSASEAGSADGAARYELAARTDDNLMQLARDGSRSAFDVLVRRHQGRVLQAARKYLGSASLAADCAQNAFVELYRARDRYEARGKFSGFLYRLVYNQCRQALRARGSERSKRRRFAAERHGCAAGAAGMAGAPPAAQVGGVGAGVGAPSADGQSAEARLLARERQRVVEAAVGQLSEKLRAVVMLRYGADLSYQEIAVALDVPVGTVKRRLFDAVAKLEKLLGEAP